MNTYIKIIFIVCVHIVSCRDFYVGMFKRNDFLVAQDRLYKERVPYRSMIAKYGRIFKCKITYFRVADRLGYGPGPNVQIVRGGLRHKYLVLRLTSPYNMPISVNIYVGCANTLKTTTAATRTSNAEIVTNMTTPQSNNTDNVTTAQSNTDSGNSTDTAVTDVTATVTT